MAILESRDVVSDTLAPFPLELVRGKEHLEAFAFFSGRCCPSSVSSLAIKASMHRRFLFAFRFWLSGMFLAVGNFSWSAIARPIRRAAPFNPTTSRAATHQLTLRFSPGLHKRTSCR